MKAVLKYIANTFDLNVLMLFLISSLFLLIMDAGEYKKKGFKKEYKFARFFGFFYIGFGFVMFVFAKLIKI